MKYLMVLVGMVILLATPLDTQASTASSQVTITVEPQEIVETLPLENDTYDSESEEVQTGDPVNIAIPFIIMCLSGGEIIYAIKNSKNSN